MSRTVVALNAHPDDEALLMSGTLAKAAGAGHRVILLLATDGDQGLTGADYDGPGLGELRLAEAQVAAEALGAQRCEWLGYADSGMTGEIPPDPPGRTRLLHADAGQVADQVVDILRAERADVLIGYDRNGGYGHRDHIRIHEIARLAAARADVPKLLEATIPRETIRRAISIARRIPGVRLDVDEAAWAQAYLPAIEITHQIDVRAQTAAKRAAMAAHVSQAVGPADGPAGGDRTLAAFLRMPRALYNFVFAREWFVDASGARPQRGVASDIFADLAVR